ncbi:unnamed protein product [Caenorhabditis auriculariae]|uniref:Peptidase M20 dimerisation domain-containing protein n=1 Tax=Caenorhabditis auriculariae TaxID=2777116 RepID=A0A8S1HFL8_9PELO|nr:unnamed protein product [Caenorhabditis auriculariae]
MVFCNCLLETPGRNQLRCFSKMSDEKLDAIFKVIDQEQDSFVQQLAEVVAIKSISGDISLHSECVKVVEWAKERLDKLGAETTIWPLGKRNLPDGQDVDLPPCVYSVLGRDPLKKTLLVYGHLDVQPADKDDGWNTDPFVLTEKDGKLFGRGSTDDKGPIVAWFAVVEVMQKLQIDIPVNLVFVLEAMEESGSEGLDEALKKNAKVFENVDFAVITDNYWLGKNKPCLTYGLRGISYYHLTVTGASQDLHSGIAGGTLPEALNDLIWLMSQLVDGKGKILVPGLQEMIAPLTDEERKRYKDIDFNPADYKKEMGAQGLLSNEKETLLQNRWRNPSLSLHGIEGAFSGWGSKTVIPGTVIGKFSIRLVPNMKNEDVDKAVISYLNDLWAKRGSPNVFKPVAGHGGPYYLADCEGKGYQAAATAIEKVFGVKPDFTREGGSIPVATSLQEVTGKAVVLLPLGACDDMAHSQNEKMNRSNFIQGTKVLAAYLLELAK